LEKLRIDFYDSGVGDTIVITFPGGGLGLVDAHPATHSSRPGIRDIVSGKKIHFVCLTHPHADHGEDLVSVLQTHPEIREFWHTTSDVPAFIYRVQEFPNYPSPVRDFASAMNRDWANFLMDIFGALAERDIPPFVLRSDLEPIVIDGVEIHCLSPEHSVQNQFRTHLFEKVRDLKKRPPDTNLLSAILALKFGQGVVLLGADALKENWNSTIGRYHKRGLAKAIILKVPHHGARNSMNWSRNSYLDICSRHPRAKAVLFAGDAKHPDRDVYELLRERTELFCLTNGLAGAITDSNPLRLSLPNARAVRAAKVCNPVVSFELDRSGHVQTLAGLACESCSTAPPAG
jgi:beta-lactamase superfamily II metal-dependent hydrolase